MNPSRQLAKLESLRSKKDFDALFRSSKHRITSEHFVLLALENNCNRARLGAVLSRKKVHLAVMRNTIKRHAREFLRNNPSTYDHLIIARCKIPSDEKKNCL